MANEDLKNPYTRDEKFLAKVAGETESAPTSQFSRLELYLAKMAGEDVTPPSDTRNRIERYLKEIIENGGGGSDVQTLTFTGNDNVEITIPALVGKDLLAAILVDTLYLPPENIPTIAIALVKGGWASAGQEYTAVFGEITPLGYYSYDLVGGNFFSEDGFLNFNATLIRGKTYLAFYK